MLGMRLVPWWEWEWFRAGNETSSVVGMGVVPCCEWEWFRAGNESSSVVGMKLGLW